MFAKTCSQDIGIKKKEKISRIYTQRTDKNRRQSKIIDQMSKVAEENAKYYIICQKIWGLQYSTGSLWCWCTDEIGFKLWHKSWHGDGGVPSVQ